MLESKVKTYLEKQQLVESLKAELAALKDEIVDEMNNEGLNNYSIDNVKAQIVNKETIKYNDELAIINYLKTNGLSRLVVEKIDTTSMNKELKSSASLNESLSQHITRTTAPTLIVKPI